MIEESYEALNFKRNAEIYAQVVSLVEDCDQIDAKLKQK